MRLILPLLFFLVIISITGPSAAAGLDFSKSITIGSGPKTVIEFTDPDCPYCRKASEYFEGRRDVTRHIYFYPLPSHPQAREKVQYILSQKDSAAAYHEIMSGKKDAVNTSEGITPVGIKLQKEQLNTARSQNVHATPTFFINGKIIEGFDQKKIEDTLGK